MKLIKTISAAILIALVFAACNDLGNTGGHFTNLVSSIVEPQTDDERTLVGEYKDFLLLVDSLAEVWESNDTLTMRRLYYNQREQWKRTEKAMEFQNVRHSLVENIGINMDMVRKEINQKLSSEFRSELYDFHEFFDLKKHYFTNLHDVKDIVDGNVYENSYGEHYLLVKTSLYEYIDRNTFPKNMVTIVKQPILESDINRFENVLRNIGQKNQASKTTAPKVETTEDNTDWDATEIDWCEKCESKDYSCCQKCKGGERSDCECKCEICMDLGNINGN